MMKSYKCTHKHEATSCSPIKALAIFLALTIALMSFTGAVLATTTDFNDEDQSGDIESGYIESGYVESGYVESGYIESGDIESETHVDNGLPSKYDLRDYNRTQSVKNQYPYQTCWAFATIASIESNLLTKDYDTYNGVDLSERHLAYFTNNREEISDVGNPLPGLEGLKGDFSHTLPQSAYLDNGGNADVSMHTLMSWLGAVNENTARYNDEMYVDLEKGLALYSDDFHVQNVTIVNIENPDVVKQMLMEKGAAVFNVNWTESPEYIKQVSENVVSYYRASDVTGMNHVVTLIGWDDNFSDFNTPPTDKGAWLLQNSWGEENSAYIWLSYYDSVTRVADKEINDVAFFEASPTSEYDNNYQYDGATESVIYNSNGATKVANVFQANSDEILKAVAIATVQPDVFYSMQIHKNPVNNNPETGTPILENPMSGVIQHAGYHTIPLTQDIELNKGDKFSIVINLSTESNKLNLSIEAYNESEVFISDPYIEQGQSYIYYNDAWTDIATNDDFKKYGNLRIKAYTKDVVPKNVFAGGDGSANDPYLIETDTQLNFVRYGLDKYYMLVRDIDLSNYSEDKGWLPIGTFGVNQFYGMFDGNGYKIKNLFVNRPDEDGVGLFGNATNAIISDVILENVSVTGRNYVGGLVGHNAASPTEPNVYGGISMIQKCRVDGNVSGSSMVGGIIGSNNISNNGSKISLINFSGCSFSGNVSGCCDVGGVIGSNNITGLSTITIMSCSASGVVKGSDSNVSDVGDGNARVSSNVGGFIGSNTCMDKGDCHISGNYATSDVFGNKSVGGLIGCNNQSGDGEIPILICYAAGCVRGFDFVGGLVGSNTLNSESDEGVIVISNCVALNPVVKAEGENINRIVGMNKGGELESNYAIKSMVNNANIFLIYDSMGEYGDDLDPKEAESEEFYKKKLSWFFDLAWKMLDSDVSTYRYPVLKADTDAPMSPTPITELPSTTGRYILDSDIELDSTWNAPQDFVSIDLNGHKISLKSGVSGSVINVENDAILSIQDSSADKSGAITGGNTDGNGGGVYIHNGILVMLGGSISNNSANCGGGVYIEVDPVDYEDYGDDIWISPTWWENFAFFGGNVTNNTAKQNGGGVYASENADFLLSGGSVDNNVAENRGGGVCVNTSSFVAYNGEITKNTAKSGGGVATVGYQFIMISDVVIKGNKAVCGGGIDLGSDLRVFDSGDNEFEDMDELNSIMMFNGTIIENEAEIGGGIYLYCGEIDYFNGIVKDNIIRKHGDGGARGYDGVQSNVYICSNSIIAVDNEISNSSCVGVTTEIEPTAGNPVEFAYIPYYDEDEWEDEGSLSDELTTPVDYTRHFFSDKSEYHVEKDDWDVFYLVKTMPVVPDLPTPTKDVSGNVTILVDEGGHINATIDETDSRKVTIQDTNSGVNLTIIFNEPQSNLSDFNGTVDEGNVFAQYNESDAIFAYGTATAKYQLNITLKDVTNLLPTISPEIKPEVKNEVIKSGMELAVMISATSNVSEINSNMTSDGLTITFTVPESWYNSMKGGVYSIHMKDGVLTKKLVTGETDGSGNVIITVKGDSFSSYGIAGFSEKPEPTPVPPAPSGGSSGSSTWLTPTPVSTVTPTATPTDVAPTTQPTSSQPTKPAGTPVPIAGLILGGLAAAAVLRRK